MIDIMSAESARQKTQEVIRDASYEELEYIKDLIQRAISKGEYNTPCHIPINAETRKILVEKGYRVGYQFVMNEGYMTMIKWD